MQLWLCYCSIRKYSKQVIAAEIIAAAESHCVQDYYSATVLRSNDPWNFKTNLCTLFLHCVMCLGLQIILDSSTILPLVSISLNDSERGESEEGV